MGAKKVIIPIAVAAVVACGVGYYCYATTEITSSSNTTVSSSNETTNSTISNNVESTGVNTSTNDSSNKVVPTVNSTISEGKASKENSTSNSNNTSSTINVESNSTSKATSNDTNTTGTTSKSSTTERTSSGTITYTVPSSEYSSSTIVVENTTGKAISESQLNEYLRSWIMDGQDNCESICDATGTYWGEPWLNKVSQDTLYQAFVNANGEAALSQNITANEFIKATQELDRLTENDVPFTLSQAKSLILSMLEEDGYATPSEVTKITFVQGSPSVYEVYTKQSGNYIYWTVYANNGYAHG